VTLNPQRLVNQVSEIYFWKRQATLLHWWAMK